MTKTKKLTKIPTFSSRDEEAMFWETHSIADFEDELTPITAHFAKNLSEGITIRFDKSTLSEIRTIAHKKGVGPTTLARMWILEHLNQAI